MDELRDPIRVLHVDDEPGLANMVGKHLERTNESFEVRTATGPDEGLAVLSEHDIDCVVSDYEMPGMDGIEFLRTVRADHPDLPFILYTGKGSEAVASDAISAGVTDYLQKEGGTDQYTILANRIANAVSARRAAVDAERRRYRLEQLLKTVPSCVVQLDREGQFVYANDRAVEVLGLEESALRERAYNDPEWEITDLDGNPIPDERLPFRQVRDSGEPLYGFRHTVSWPDGTEKALLVNGAPMLGEDGDVESVIFALTDITERLEHEERLGETTARLQALFEQSPDMINVHDAAGNIVEPNRRMQEELGYTGAELSELKVWDIDRNIDPEAARAMWAGMEPGDRRTVEGRYERKDGSTFPTEVHLRRLAVAGEDRFVVISRDISERKEREQDLAAMERRLEAILENTTMPMFMKDDEGRYIFVNRGYRELFGLGDEPIAGRTDEDIHPPAVAEEVSPNDRAVIESGESIDVEERIAVDGEERTFLVSKVPIHDTGYRADPDRPVAVFGVGSDVTDLKTREQQLRAFQRRTEDVIRGSTRVEIAEAAVDIAEDVLGLSLSGVHLVDDDGTTLRPAALTADARQMLGEDAVYDREDPDRAAERTNWEVFEAGETLVIGDTRDHDRVDAASTPSRSGILQPLGDHGLFITSSPEPHAFDDADVAFTEILATILTASLDRAGREAALSEQKRRLEAEAERLEAFASVVSHDLRNPLSVADGHLELARETGDDDHFDRVAEAHDRMRALIEDLLRFARQGEEATDTASVALGPLVEETWDNVDTANATLRNTANGTVMADEGRLQQLLENLFRNAVEHGGPEVTVTVDATDDGFAVEDDGPGIPEGEREAVFDSGYSTSDDGTGFGLAIVREIAHAHGWEVDVTESADGGARFRITGVEEAG